MGGEYDAAQGKPADSLPSISNDKLQESELTKSQTLRVTGVALPLVKQNAIRHMEIAQPVSPLLKQGASKNLLVEGKKMEVGQKLKRSTKKIARNSNRVGLVPLGFSAQAGDVKVVKPRIPLSSTERDENVTLPTPKSSAWMETKPSLEANLTVSETLVEPFDGEISEEEDEVGTLRSMSPSSVSSEKLTDIRDSLKDPLSSPSRMSSSRSPSILLKKLQSGAHKAGRVSMLAHEVHREAVLKKFKGNINKAARLSQMLKKKKMSINPDLAKSQAETAQNQLERRLEAWHTMTEGAVDDTMNIYPGNLTEAVWGEVVDYGVEVWEALEGIEALAEGTNAEDLAVDEGGDYPLQVISTYALGAFALQEFKNTAMETLAQAKEINVAKMTVSKCLKEVNSTLEQVERDIKAGIDLDEDARNKLDQTRSELQEARELCHRLTEKLNSVGKLEAIVGTKFMSTAGHAAGNIAEAMGKAIDDLSIGLEEVAEALEFVGDIGAVVGFGFTTPLSALLAKRSGSKAISAALKERIVRDKSDSPYEHRQSPKNVSQAGEVRYSTKEKKLVDHLDNSISFIVERGLNRRRNHELRNAAGAAASTILSVVGAVTTGGAAGPIAATGGITFNHLLKKKLGKRYASQSSSAEELRTRKKLDKDFDKDTQLYTGITRVESKIISLKAQIKEKERRLHIAKAQTGNRGSYRLQGELNNLNGALEVANEKANKLLRKYNSRLEKYNDGSLEPVSTDIADSMVSFLRAKGGLVTIMENHVGTDEVIAQDERVALSRRLHTDIDGTAGEQTIELMKVMKGLIDSGQGEAVVKFAERLRQNFHHLEALLEIDKIRNPNFVLDAIPDVVNALLDNPFEREGPPSPMTLVRELQ